MKTGKILLLIIFILGINSCNSNQKKPPMAKQGILDLRSWDFEKDGNVRLDGDWEFYWHEFLSSKDFDTVQQKHYIRVPKPWNDYKWGKQELGYEGYATYRLRIIVNKNIKDFGLKFPDQGTAFELYLNDSLVGKNGKTGKTRETMQPQYKPLLIAFQNNKDTIDIVCRISNFHFHFGGLYFAAEVGSESVIRANKEDKVVRDYIFASLLLLISFILLIFFILRPKDYLSLFFSICSFTSAFRTISVGEKIISNIFPNLNWEWCIRIEGLSWFLWGVFLVSCFKLLLKENYSKIITISFSIVYSIISLITILTPARINSQLILIAELLALIWILYTVPVLIKCIIKKVESSLLIFIGLIPFILATSNEILYYNNLMPIMVTVGYGLFSLGITQIIILSRLFARSYKKVENYAKDLKIEVEEKTKDLREEKEKSEKLLLNVLPEQIANRLKEGETPIADHFEEASVIFIDIVDFTKMSEKSSPQMMVKMLNEIFTIFDKIAAKYGLEKIKTIGDCYMAAAGIPVPREDHAEAIAMMALDVMKTMKDYKYSSDDSQSSDESKEIKFRIGLDCGPIVAGVIGEQKFIYDLWGDMVNTASRMETNGIIGKIQCTERFKNALTLPSPSGRGTEGEGFKFIERGEIEIKGKGKMRTWFLIDN